MFDELQFDTLLNFTPDPIAVVDEKGTFLAVNNKLYAMTGFRRKELIGNSFLISEIITSQSKAILRRNMITKMSGDDIQPYKIEVRTKDGKLLSIEVNGVRI